MMSRIFFVVCLALALGSTGLLAGAVFPAQAAPLSAEAQTGLRVWQSLGCEGCHTLYGLGSAYAPDLTHIYSINGETYLREFFVNPNAFHPDQRPMPRFTLTRDEVTGLIALLRYTSGEDGGVQVAWGENLLVSGAGGMALPGQSASGGALAGEDARVAHGRQLFGQHCASCHSLERDTIIKGPSLWGIADRAWHRIPGLTPQQYIRNSVLDPSELVVDGFQDVMQKNLAEMLSSDDLDALEAFLMTFEETE
jgi:mono/diheme cytochrome c family protein